MNQTTKITQKTINGRALLSYIPMDITVDIQIASDGDDAPDPALINAWVESVLQESDVIAQAEIDHRPIELSLRVVNNDESQTLNREYRGKDRPTNVLSFPSDATVDLPFRHFGDLVICAPVVRNEAQEQEKTIQNHWAHMVVHGTLHLAGFDHIEADDAVVMETIEKHILAKHGIDDPYRDSPQQQAV